MGLNLSHTWQLLYTVREQVVDVQPGTLAPPARSCAERWHLLTPSRPMSTWNWRPLLISAAYFRAPARFHWASSTTCSILGFRGVAQPFVVGYVDIGYGSEGIAAFTGLNYPF